MVALLLGLLLAADDGYLVRGVVRDGQGLPIPQVSVYVEGTQSLSLTDSEGRFELAVPAQERITLVAFRHAFKPRQVEVTLGGSHDLELLLEPALTESVTVVAPHPSEARLLPVDVVRMPGAQADPFLALQTLPGMAKVDEGAGLFVQGGDTSEVLFLLDGTVISHPYKYETLTGGLFGSVEPFLLEGLSFSTAGFSARYGDALSGVLEMRGLSRPPVRQYYATVGLGGTSGQFATPLGSRGGVRLSGNKAFTQLLFAVNGSPRKFQRYPQSWDLNGSLHYDSPRLGSFKLFGMGQGDDVGVELEQEEFTGLLDAGSDQRVFSGRWERALGSWSGTLSIGQDHYVRQTSAGVFDIDLADRNRSARLGVVRPLGRWLLRLGIDGDHRRSAIAGQVPTSGGDFGGRRSGQRVFDVHFDDWHGGAYVETERSFGRATAVVGTRVDRFDRSDVVMGAPRASLVVGLSAKQRLRLAWGRYSQVPSPEYYDETFGAPHLSVMQAQHWVAGYERGTETGSLFVRAEVYHKSYERLPVETPGGGFTSDGYGSANGFDLFARGHWRPLEFRIGYSWLQARRRWTPIFQAGRYQLPSGTWSPDFDIPQTLHAMANYKATSALTLGMSWRVASGKPFTPVLGATPTALGFDPTYGVINSDRYPLYSRVDASASYMTSLGSHTRVLFFSGVTNLTARQNIFQYKYTPDFAHREPVLSAAPRSFYFGIAIFG